MASSAAAFIANSDLDDGDGLMRVDKHIEVFWSPRELSRTHHLHMLLNAMRHTDGKGACLEGTECETAKAVARLPSCDGVMGSGAWHHDIVDMVQSCCSNREKRSDAAEQGFIDLYLALHSLTAEGAAPQGVLLLNHLLVDVPSSASGVCMAKMLQVEAKWLQMMDVFGRPDEEKEEQHDQRLQEESQRPPGLSIVRLVIDSFRIVTDDILPKCLYYVLEPLLCELSYCWLLNCPFADVPMRLIGTAEGLRAAREQVDLEESSLRFLLSMETAVAPTHALSSFSSNVAATTNVVVAADSADETLAQKYLGERLMVATAMQSALATDMFLMHLAEEWRVGVEALRASFTKPNANAATTVEGLWVSSSPLAEDLDRVLQLSPRQLAYHIVHSFRLPLTQMLPTLVTEHNTQLDETMEVITVVVGPSFDGRSLEEVEYLLQPADTDHTAEMPSTGRMGFTARLYAHFHRLFALLFRSCSIHNAEVAVLPSTFFDTCTSPFVRAVHSTRLAGMRRCHYYALFDVLVESSWTLRTLIIIVGDGWADEARNIFTQWLEERQRQQRRHAGLSCSIVFKHVENNDGKYPDGAEGAEYDRTSSGVLGRQSLLLSLLQRIVAACGGLKVAVLIPARGVTVLSRRYGVLPLRGSLDEPKATTSGVAETTTHPLFSALLQNTVMPVVSYSVCGGVPLSYVCDAADVACKSV